MAIGDDAAAAGMSLVAGSVLANTIDTELNRTRDFIAQRTSTVTPVNKGGTGATTAAAARTALGVPAIAHTHAAVDITTSGSNAQADIDFLATTKVNRAGDTMTGTLTIVGSHAVTGNIENNGNLRSSGVRSTTVSSWINVGVDPSGFLGNTSSSRTLKKYIKNFDDPGDFDAIKVREFQWKKFPGPVDHGVIAQEMQDAGYDWLVTGEGGDDLGVRYELLALALIPVVQELRKKVADLEAKLA